MTSQFPSFNKRQIQWRRNQRAEEHWMEGEPVTAEENRMEGESVRAVENGMEGAPVIGDENAKTSWEVEVDKMLADGEPSRLVESARWRDQSIYRVPKLIKDMNSKAYQPQLVSLGPFHHGDSNLLPMEEHKLRALVHLVKRSGKPLKDFIAAVEEVADKLEAAYGKDLDDRWRGENRHRFVEVMVTDGCFLLEILMGDLRDYEPHDPFFGTNSRFYLSPVIQSDMLVMENQLPLLLLHTLVAVRFDIPRAEEMGEGITRLVLKFIDRSFPGDVINHLPLKLHPLDLYYRSLVYGAGQDRRSQLREHKHNIMPSAVKIHESGIKFRKSKTNSLNDIHFHFEDGVLSMPVVEVKDHTGYLFLNLMEFERLHVAVGTFVTDYVIFLENIIDSVEDVALLSSEGVLKSFLGSDAEVTNLFDGTLSRGAVLGLSMELEELQWNVKAYCGNKRWAHRIQIYFRNKRWAHRIQIYFRNSWADLIQTYFRSPWTFISVVAAAILLAATLVQTVFTVMQFKRKP